MRNNFSGKLTDTEIYDFLKEHYPEIMIGEDPRITGVLSGLTRNVDGSIEWTKTICIDPETDNFAYAHLELSDFECKEYKGAFDSRNTSDTYATMELPYLVMMSKKFKHSVEYQKLLKSYILGKYKELREYFKKFQNNISNDEKSESYIQFKEFYDAEIEYIDKLCKAVLDISIEELSTIKPQHQPA